MFGAMFGLLGSFFRITPFFSGLSILLAGLFLIIYGLNLLNLFAPLKAIRIKLPAAVGRITNKMRWKSRSPFFVGFLSGFILGCGPLQAMYVLAAGLGNPMTGAIALTFYGLGTLPALMGFGFLARMLSNSITSRIIHATGVILIVMGFMMFHKGLTRTSAANEVESVPACCQH
jgi:sulfite exporter TauE/SafE